MKNMRIFAGREDHQLRFCECPKVTSRSRLDQVSSPDPPGISLLPVQPCIPSQLP
jgi:hypothetical protein